MNLLWIKTKCKHENGLGFKNDGSEFIHWDAVIITANQLKIDELISKDLKEMGYVLLEMTHEPLDRKSRPDEIIGRESAIWDAAKNAALRAVTCPEIDPFFIEWSCWCMSEKELDLYYAPEKKYLWKVVYKTKVSYRSGVAFDGSTYHYKKMLVPADDKTEVLSIINSIEYADYAELHEVLLCEAWEDGAINWFDLYDFSKLTDEDAKLSIEYGAPKIVDAITEESLDLIKFELKDRRG